MTALLEVEDLRVRFGAHEAVRGIDFSIERGETLALVGESGCGKSTTALSLLRLLPPQASVLGSARLDGADLLAMRERALRQVRGNRVSMVFQEPMSSLNPVLSIGEQIAEVLRQHQKISARAARLRAIELLELVKIPRAASRVDDHPHQLSGGQRQRVMIAIAVACRPQLLIADEPTTALDVTVQAQILALLKELVDEFSMGLLLITHDLGVVGQWADRVAVMRQGRIVDRGVTQRLFSAPSHAYTRELLAASMWIDSDIHYRRTPLADGDAPVLSVRDLRVAYPTPQGPVTAVDGVSFDIRPGETLGLVGESGCGKSSLSRAVLRLVAAQSGEVRLDGEDLLPLSEADLRARRRKVQMVFQDPYASLNPRHTVRQILESSLRVHGVDDAKARAASVADIVRRVGLPADALERYPHEFSGGQRQRIAIARTLVLKPKLVICDEPVSSLDVSVRAQILDLLVDLKDEFGLSLLFISHDLAVVKYIADRVLVMHDGRIVETGDAQTLWSTAQHPYTRSLVAAVPEPTYERPPRAQRPEPSILMYRFAI